MPTDDLEARVRALEMSRAEDRPQIVRLVSDAEDEKRTRHDHNLRIDGRITALERQTSNDIRETSENTVALVNALAAKMETIMQPYNERLRKLETKMWMAVGALMAAEVFVRPLIVSMMSQTHK